MKILTAKRHSWGITCEEIGFKYVNTNVIRQKDIVGVKILGIDNNTKLPMYVEGLEIAVVDKFKDYLLLFACFRKKAEEFETIRRSKKTVIVICGEDFNFIEDVEQYVAAGAVVMATNKLRSYNG